MTDDDTSERDELVAAYLDGEASAEERALVEADPDLMARVAVMRQMAAAVAEPVIPPPLEVRNSHIAAALAASATAPNVTSLAPRRRRWSVSQAAVLSAAAVVLVVLLAVPVLFLSAGGDDDDAATSTESADEALSNSEIAVADGAAHDAPAAEVPAEESTDELAEEPEEEPAEEPAEEPVEQAAAEAPDADLEEPAEEAAAEEAVDDGGESGQFTVLDPEAPALDTGELADIDALVERVLDELVADPTSRLTLDDLGLDLQCVDALGELAIEGERLLFGRSVVAGQAVEFAAIGGAGGAELFVLDATSCETSVVAPLVNG